MATVTNNVVTNFTARDGISTTLGRASASARRFSTASQESFGRAKAGAQAFHNALKQTSKSFDSLSKIAQGVTIGNIVSKGLSMGVNLVRNNIGDAINYASDLIETQNVVDTVFKNSSKEISDWAGKTQGAFGLSELQAKKFVSTTGSILQGMGFTDEAQVARMSKGITALAGDLGSFYNLDPGDAFNKLRAGLTGETEPLKALGIVMTDTNLKAYALSKGIKEKWADLDQRSKTLVRVNYLMEQTRNAQGDYGKPIESWAVSSRNFSAAVEEMKGRFAEGLLPVLIQAADWGTKVASAIGMWAKENKGLITQKFTAFVKGAINGARATIEVIKTVVSLSKVIIPLWGLFKLGKGAVTIMNAVNLATLAMRTSAVATATASTVAATSTAATGVTSMTTLATTSAVAAQTTATANITAVSSMKAAAVNAMGGIAGAFKGKMGLIGGALMIANELLGAKSKLDQQIADSKASEGKWGRPSQVLSGDRNRVNNIEVGQKVWKDEETGRYATSKMALPLFGKISEVNVTQSMKDTFDRYGTFNPTEAQRRETDTIVREHGRYGESWNETERRWQKNDEGIFSGMQTGIPEIDALLKKLDNIDTTLNTANTYHSEELDNLTAIAKEGKKDDVKAPKVRYERTGPMDFYSILNLG